MEPREPTPGHFTSELKTATPRSPQTRSAPLDAAVGLAALGFGAVSFLVREANRVARPLAELALHPPLVPQRLQPARALEMLAKYGRATTSVVGDDLGRVLTAVVPFVVKEVLDRLDLTAIVRQRVDLDAVVADVDIGRVIDRVDLDAIVAQVDIASVIDRLDLDAIVAKVNVAAVLDTLDLDGVVGRVDLNAVVDRLDLDSIVAKVNIEAVLDTLDLDGVVGRVDLNAVVDRLDLDSIVAKVNIEAVLDTLDLDAIIARVDLNGVIARVDIDGIVSEVDLTAVIDRLNVVGIAEDVINEIDLPEIIRDSTGSMASEMVRGARMQSIDADEAISRLFDRLIRRRQRKTALTAKQSARLRQDEQAELPASQAPALPPAAPTSPGGPAPTAFPPAYQPVPERVIQPPVPRDGPDRPPR